MPGLQPGLTFWLIVRLLLDRCATVDEGLELLHVALGMRRWVHCRLRQAH